MARLLCSLAATLLLATIAPAQVVVASYYNSGLLKYDASGGGLQQTYITPTNTPPGPTGLNAPSSITVGPDSALYISSQNSNSVLKYDLASGVTSTFISSATLQAISPTYSPAGIRFGPDGNVYLCRNEGNFASPGTGAIDRFSPTGTPMGTLAVGLSQPTNIEFHNNELYFSQRIGFNVNGYGTIDKITAYTSPVPVSAVNVVSTNNAGLENPTGMAFDSLNRLYIADVGGSSNGVGCAVRRYDITLPGGTAAGVSGTPGDAVFAIPDGGGNGALPFQFPADVRFLPNGKLMVANIGFSNNPDTPFGNVLVYNGTSGVFEYPIATGVSAASLAFTTVPEPALLVALGGIVLTVRRRLK